MDDLAQPSGAPERYGCGTPLAGVARPPRTECAGDRIRRMRETFCDCTAVPFFAVTPQLSLRGHSSSQTPYPSPRRKRQVSSIALLVLSKQQTLRWFAVWSHFCLARKKYAKKRRWTRNSAYAQKGVSLHSTFFRYTFCSPNALRATVESGFCIARYSVRVVTLAPVEYLTYGSRGVSDLA